MLAATADVLRMFESDSHDQPAGDLIELVQAARRGDRAAFTRLHQRFAPMVHGIILARASTTDVADLVQQTFLEGLQKLRSLRDPAAFGGWIAAIARNLATQSRRDRARTSHLTLTDRAVEIRQDHPDDARQILAMIRSLPEAYGETLVLRLVEGMTGPQIAACTGMTAGSVRVNLHRGMQLLRQRLQQEGAT